MIFYIGDIVKGKVTRSQRVSKNKIRQWKYGYDKDIDTVIISRDGTLGDIYNIMGVNIGLPECPDKKEIINNGLAKFNQKWKRHELPKGLDEHTMGLPKYEEYIDREFKRRDQGVWIFINGHPIYIPGTYYFGIQWVRENNDYPNFRQIQNELMIFWEACKADQRSYGMQYVKNRRIGASFLAIVELLDSGTITEDKLLGLISKKGSDARKIFRRLIKGFKRLPCFFMPVWDGTNSPKTELVLEEPTKRKKAGEKVTEGDGLGTVISWHNTEMNAMDGDNIFRSLLDESGKYPKEVPFSEYWYIVKTSHRLGRRIVGKSMVVSTVNAMKKGGSEYFKIWKDSDATDRTDNDQTKSGLYRLFIAAKYCEEGFFDEFGFSIVEDPTKPVMTDEGIFTEIGCETFLANEAKSFEDDPEKLNEFMRQHPTTIKDAFRDTSDSCEFDLIKLQDQIDHNQYELDDQFEEDATKYRGNDKLERGNFRWENGIQDTKVIWTPDPENGRFFIKSNCHPPQEFRNTYEEKWQNGVLAKGPMAAHIGSAGVDPYNRSKTVDKRGSYGSYILSTKTHTCDELPNNQIIVEYIDRPKKVELFFEDVIMVSVYYSIPFLSELSNDRFLAYVKDRGYRHFSLNNPFKKKSDLSTAELEFGGAPQQDAKIRDAQAAAVESYIVDYIGVSSDSSVRPRGEMGDCPFNRTLYQLKDFDVDKRTKYDAFIAFSLSLLANQKVTSKPIEKVKPRRIPFQIYDNTNGYVSQIAT